MGNITLIVNRGTPPSIAAAPTVSGTHQVGEVLTATKGTESGDGTLSTGWQWLRDGVAIPGAGNSTYTLVQDDEGTNISVRQTTSSEFGSATRVSTATLVVAGPSGDVVISGTPTITGTAEVGQTLTANAAPTTGTEPITTTWQWLRDGIEIAGATNGTYTLVQDDDLKAISVEQTSSNSVPSSDTAISASVTVGVPTIEVQLLALREDDAGNTNIGTGSVSYDLTGDWDIVVFTGPSDKPITLDINGVDCPRILPEFGTDPYPSAGGRLGVFKTTLTGLTGAGTLNYTLTMGAADSTYPIGFIAVKGGDLQPVTNSQNWKFTGEGDEIGYIDVAAPHNGAFLLGLACGRASFFADEGGEVFPAWTSLDQQASITNSGTNEGASVNWSLDNFAGYYNEGVEQSTNATDRLATAFLIWTPKNAPIPPASVQAWTLEDDAAVTGDVAKLDIQAVPYLDGSVVDHYELEIQKASGSVIERVLYGSFPNYVRRHRMDADATTTCRIRPIYRDLSTLAFSNGPWSGTKDVTTTTGTQAITLNASLATVYTGECAVISVDDERGFDLITTENDGTSCKDPWHELDYWIEVDDVAEQGALTVLPTYYTDRGFSTDRHNCRARKWAFPPQTTGVKTFTATVRDLNGNEATDTVQVTAVDPITDFDPANVYAFSSTSDFAGLPGGINQYTDWATFVAAIPASGDALLLIHDDEVQGDHTLLSRTNMGSFHIRNYGGGTNRPKLDWPIYVSGARCSIHGIDLESTYNPADYPAGVSFRPGDGIDISNCSHGSVSWCRTVGFNLNLYYPSPGATLAVNDWYSTRWANFGLFGDNGGKLVITGGFNCQDPDTIRPDGVDGGKGETIPPVFADHGPFRISRPKDDTGISRYVSFSCNTWGGIGNPQPCFRWWGSGYTPRPINHHLVEAITEGTTFGITDTSRAGGTAISSPQSMVVDSCIHTLTFGPGSGWNVRMGGTTFKNSLLVATSNQKREGLGSGLRNMVSIGSEHLTPYPPNDNPGQPIEFIACTLIDQHRDGENNNDAFSLLSNGASGAAFTTVRFIECVESAPFYTAAHNPDAPIDATPLGTTAFYQQRVSWTGTVNIDATYGVLNEAFANFTPQAGSAAYQSAVSPYLPYRDVTGAVRGGSPSRGYREPA